MFQSAPFTATRRQEHCSKLLGGSEPMQGNKKKQQKQETRHGKEENCYC